MLGFGKRTPDKNMQIGAAAAKAQRTIRPARPARNIGVVPPAKNSHIKIRGER